MKRITAIIIAFCMAATGICTGTADRIMTGMDREVSAASYPALKKVDYKATGNQQKDIIGFAKTQIGYAEGRNNNTYFGNWFGANYNPWCAMFVCWSARKAGVTKSVIPQLATADRSWAKNQGVYHKSKQWGGSYKPKKGDLIYFSWSVRDWADHIGMVTGTEKSGGVTYVKTVEGNKHDKVTTGSYALNNRYILGYASPKYKKNENTSGDKTETTQTTAPATTQPTTAADSEKEPAQSTQPGTPPENPYTLKYRDGLDETSNDEEDGIIPPVTGGFGMDLVLSTAVFKRTGYKYKQMDVYRVKKDGTLIYLCLDKASASKEKWYAKNKIPDTYSQVLVNVGGSLRINKKVSGTIYVSPVWKKKKYTITYDANGGSNAPAAQKKTYKKNLTLTSDKPKWDGYKFMGWAADKEALKPEYSGGETYEKNKSLTLYAVWELKSYQVRTTAKITSRSGPGTSFTKGSSIASGTDLSIRRIKEGWGLMKDGKWIDLTYTLRQKVTEYQLYYDDGIEATTNDSEIIETDTVSYGKALTASSKSYEREGFSYSAWKLYHLRNGKKVYLYHEKGSDEEKWKHTIPDGGKIVKVGKGDKLTIKGAVGDRIFLTPVWKRDKYSITYKANGGKNAPKDQTKTYGKVLKLRKDKPTRLGYKFLGWSADRNAATASYKASGDYTVEGNAVLYAVWKSTSFKVKVTKKATKRKGPGSNYASVGSVKKGKTVTIVKKKKGWGRLKAGGWIDLSLTKKVKTKGQTVHKGADADTAKKGETSSGAGDAAKKTPEFTVKVTTADGLNARYGPGDDYDTAQSFDFGETLKIRDVENGWGKLAEEDSGQWILLKHVRIEEGYQVKVTAEDLNQRSGPGMEYEIKDAVAPGTYTIVKIDGDWGKLKSTGRWIDLEYAQRVDDEESN